MNYDIVLFTEATRQARSNAQSALPDAPVVADFLPKERGTRLQGIRQHLSGGLHQLADRVAPAQPVMAIESGQRSQSC